MADLFNALSSILDLVVGFIDSIVQFFDLMFKSMSYLVEMVAYLPPYFSLAAGLLISVAIVCLVIDRG